MEARRVFEEKARVRREGVFLIAVGIDGKEYRFGRPGEVVHLAASREIRRIRKQLFEEVVHSIKDLPPETATAVAVDAFRDLSGTVGIPYPEVSMWLGSPEGQEWIVAQCTMAACSIDVEEAKKIFGKITPMQYAALDRWLNEPSRDALSALKAMLPDQGTGEETE